MMTGPHPEPTPDDAEPVDHDWYRTRTDPAVGVPTIVVASYAPGSTDRRPVTVWLDVTDRANPDAPEHCFEAHMSARNAARLAVVLLRAAVRAKMRRQEADVLAVARP